MPEWTLATITLESPCDDLGLAAMRWSEVDRCPEGSAHNIGECEGVNAGGGGDFTLYADDSEIGYLVSVDGEAGAPFALSVTCESR